METTIKTIFEKWRYQEWGFTNLGGFQTALFQAYLAADGDNKLILEKAYPLYFTLEGDKPRIAPEQIDADKNLLNNLQARLNDWKAELEWTEKELIEQSLIDTKAGNGKSSRYLALEKNEKQLKANIAEAEQKLGRVEERVANPAFAGLVNKTIENLK